MLSEKMVVRNLLGDHPPYDAHCNEVIAAIEQIIPNPPDSYDAVMLLIPRDYTTRIIELFDEAIGEVYRQEGELN
jgi:hypothetical protein